MIKKISYYNFSALLIASLGFSTHAFAQDTSDSSPPPQEIPTEETSGAESSDNLVLDTIEVSTDGLDQPFQKTDYYRDKMGLANDGAELLKQTPGISVIRQGGTASDPLLRGLGGTRLNISIDGVPFGGVCNHRMDPATAYVSPGSFDSMSLLKGPQSVRNGNSIVGTVNFDREPIKYDEPGAKVYASYLYGSFDRQNLSVDSSAGFDQGYLNYTHNNASGSNYYDGDGNEVHLTFYDTSNDRFAIGYTPDDDTLFEVTGLWSKGEMGNATIHMDVTQLDRQNYGAHFKKSNINKWLRNIDLRYDFTTVDHAMDNYTLRHLEPNHEFVLMGQYWDRHFAKLETTFDLNDDWELLTGIDYRNDSYDANAAGGLPEFEPIPDLDQLPKNHILDFDNIGAYAELKYQMNDSLRWVTGLRGDSLGTNTGTMHAAGEVSDIVLSGSNQHHRQGLFSAFLRAEYQLDTLPVLFSVGYGHAERAPDYWEVYSMDGFDLNPERNDELDVMANYSTDNFSAEISGFYSYITDFILVHGGADADNINAQRVGGELSLSYRVFEYFTLLGNISYTHGDNLTQNTPLAQTPPLEGNIGIQYEQGPFNAGINTRLVNKQTRIHSGYGNTLAIDTTPTAGFVTASLELGYKPHDSVQLKFGIDNLLDKTYTEHLNRNASASVGGPSIRKINEPGRVYWGRISIDFDYFPKF